MELSDWNRCLLLGSLLIVLAAMGLVSGRLLRDRILATGVFIQGIVILFVAASAFYSRDELEFAAVALLPMFALWILWIRQDGLPMKVVRPARSEQISSEIASPIDSPDNFAPNAPAPIIQEPKDAE